MMSPRARGRACHRLTGFPEEVLDHFVSGTSWRVPSTLQLRVERWRDGTSIVNLWWTDERPLSDVDAGPGLLEDFLKLERASDEAVLRYAQRWGPLWLCGHELPYRHARGCTPGLGGTGTRGGKPSKPYYAYFERVESWHSIAREAGAVVRIARQLHNGQFGRPEDWASLSYLPVVLEDMLYWAPPDPMGHWETGPQSAAARELELLVDSDELIAQYTAEDEERRQHQTGRSLNRTSVQRGEDDLADESGVEKDDYEGDPGEEDLDGGLPTSSPHIRRVVELFQQAYLGSSLAFQRNLLAELVNYWLRMGGVEPQMEWSEKQPQVHLSGQGLFAALAVQLLFETSRTDGLAVCTSCGTPFLPPVRRPRRDHNAYCSDCGLKAARRDAAARYRQTAKYRATYDKWLRERRGSPGS